MFERRLHYLLDQRHCPSEDAVLREHAEVCHRCSRLLLAQEQLFAVLESSRPPGLEPDFSEYVVSVARRLARERRSRQRRTGGLAAALAAAALAVALAVVIRPAARPPQPAPRGGVVAPPTATTAHDVGRSPALWPDLSLSLAYPRRLADGDSSAEIAQRMRQWYRQSADRGLEPVNRLTGDLRPIATTVNAAFDTILDVVRSDPADPPPSG